MASKTAHVRLDRVNFPHQEPFNHPAAIAAYLNEEFDTGATISATGTGEEDVTAVIKIRKGTTVITSDITEVDVEGNWNDAIDPPGGGWAVGDDYEAEIWYAGAEQDQNTFKVVDVE